MLISKPSIAAPAWTKGKSLVQNGNELTVICHAESVSGDQGREETRSSCLHAATTQLQTTFSVNSLEIETDKDVALHKSISTKTVVTGLNCILLDEYIDDAQQPVQTWQKCRFDLSKAKIIDTPKSLVQENEKVENDSKENVSEYSDGLPIPSLDSLKQRKSAHTDKRTYLIASTPNCDDILVKSRRSRTLSCNVQPVTLILNTDDETVLIRSKGYLPKELLVKDLLNGNSVEDKEGIINVFLEKL